MTEHSVVYHDPGFRAATPANNGGNGPTWQWGDELLIGFTRGTFLQADKGHQCTYDRPFESHLARRRSTDGGASWTTWQPSGFAGNLNPAEARPLGRGLDFSGEGVRAPRRGRRLPRQPRGALVSLRRPGRLLARAARVHGPARPSRAGGQRVHGAHRLCRRRPARAVAVPDGAAPQGAERARHLAASVSAPERRTRTSTRRPTNVHCASRQCPDRVGVPSIGGPRAVAMPRPRAPDDSAEVAACHVVPN